MLKALPVRLRVALGALALGLLPFLALPALGFLWLWEHGHTLMFALAALLCVLLGWGWHRTMSGLEAWAEQHRSGGPEDPPPLPGGADPLEQAVLREISAKVKATDVETITSVEQLVTFGHAVVAIVTRHYRRDDPEAMWDFRVVEALLLSEQVSRDLRRLAMTSVPLGDQITVAQLFDLSRLVGKVGVYRHVYTAYRIARMMWNPAGAVLAEAGGQVTSGLLAEAGRTARAHMLRLFAEQVGRAAIDLYSGRLRLTPEELAGRVTAAAEHDAKELAKPAEPLRIVLAGQVSAGKSSLVNALSAQAQAAVDVLATTSAYTPYSLMCDGEVTMTLLDGPGLDGTPRAAEGLIAQAQQADLILWVVAADRPAREPDRAALAALRQWFGERSQRRPPPVLVVASHIDRLRPFNSWTPPYDLRSTDPKTVSIRQAVTAISEDLQVDQDAVIAACLIPEVGRYNIDAIFAAMHALLPAARAARIQRITMSTTGLDLARVLEQVTNAGRILVRQVTG